MYHRLQLDDLLAPSEGDGVLAIFPVVGGDIIPDQIDFTVSPLPLVVERFFAWIGAIRGWQGPLRPPSSLHAPPSPHPSCCSSVGLPVFDDLRNGL